MALLVGYALSHPEIIIKAAFALLDAVPNYTNFVMNHLYKQLVHEIEARLSDRLIKPRLEALPLL